MTIPAPHEDSWPGLAAAASEFDVHLDGEMTQRFARYRDLLLERNARVNLTALKNPTEVERRLFLDALAMLPAIDAFLATITRPGSAPVRLIDIGSGAGFPGLALKIARPALDVTLVDATAKKVSFVNDAIAELGLESASALHGRAEELARDPRFRERFTIGTARAVASLPVLLELVIPFLDVGGQAFFPKGSHLDAEIKAGRRAAATLGARIVSTTRTPAGDTRLIIAEKTTLTGKTYPRRTGIPSRMPLGGGG